MKICNECNKEFDEINNFSANLKIGDIDYCFCSLDCFMKWTKNMIKDKPSCRTKKCKYQGSISYDYHICCNHPIVESNMSSIMNDMLRSLSTKGGQINSLDSIVKQMGIIGDKSGIKNGWFNWPINFDPTWLINCNKFEIA